jgi:hypothetical protein
MDLGDSLEVNRVSVDLARPKTSFGPGPIRPGFASSARPGTVYAIDEDDTSQVIITRTDRLAVMKLPHGAVSSPSSTVQKPPEKRGLYQRWQDFLDLRRDKGKAKRSTKDSPRKSKFSSTRFRSSKNSTV